MYGHLHLYTLYIFMDIHLCMDGRLRLTLLDRLFDRKVEQIQQPKNEMQNQKCKNRLQT